MKLATLACLSALCLTASLAYAAPGESAAKSESTTQSPAAPAGAPGRGEPAAARGDGKDTAKGEASKADAGKGERQASGRDRRRPSYAACNRASHQRGYRGGRRRRFLIRCRLGYERPRAQQHQTPAAPANPVRKP